MLSHWIVPVFALWCVAMVLVFLRKSIPMVWKLSALLVLLFYCGWFYDDLFLVAWPRWKASAGAELPLMLGALVTMLPAVLLIAWPITLFSAYRDRTAEKAARSLRTLTLLTLFYWIFWFLAYMAGLDLTADGLGGALRGVLPERWELPDLPDPPVAPGGR